MGAGKRVGSRKIVSLDLFHAEREIAHYNFQMIIAVVKKGNTFIMKATESQFRETLEKATVPVVVDFYADWCGPCRAFGPIFEKAASDLAPEFSLCKVNIDEANALCEEVGVRVVPTVMVFNQSRQIAVHEGSFAGVKELELFIRNSVK